MDTEEKNPWAVRNLKEFLYFCCPECDVKNQSEELFLQHALNEHPKAKECIPKLEFKQEIQGNPSQTGENDLVLREGRKDISDIQWQYFSRKLMPFLISELVFVKKDMENYEKSQ